MNRNLHLTFFTVAAWLVSSSFAAHAQDIVAGVSNAWGRVKDEGKRASVIARVKTAYADRKDIPGRYIRVRFDGHTLQLAGFVPSKDIAKAAEDVARQVVQPESIQTFWCVEDSLSTSEPYKTYVGEQAQDAVLKGKVLTSLNSPDVRPQLANAEIALVDVTHGNVVVYVIADAPPAEVDLEPHVKPIPGVVGFQCKVLKAY